MSSASHSTIFNVPHDSKGSHEIICKRSRNHVVRLLIPDDDLFKMMPNHKINLQPRAFGTMIHKPRDSSLDVPSLDNDDIFFPPKELLLDESQFVYNTPKPTSRQSLYSKALKAPRLMPLDTLKIPSLGQVKEVPNLPIPHLVVNSSLHRRKV